MNFIMLTRLVGKQVHSIHLSVEELEKEVKDKIAYTCPEVKWVSNYALLGPYDYLDIFEAPNMEEAMRVATLVRSFGHASTEVWPALQWEDFKKVVSDLPLEDEPPTYPTI